MTSNEIEHLNFIYTHTSFTDQAFFLSTRRDLVGSMNRVALAKEIEGWKTMLAFDMLNEKYTAVINKRLSELKEELIKKL